MVLVVGLGKVPAVTLYDHLREPRGTRTASYATTPSRRFPQTLRAVPRHPPSRPLRRLSATPSTPPGRPSAEVRETSRNPSAGFPTTPPTGLAEPLQELGHHAPRRPDRPPQQLPPPRSTDPHRPPQHARSAPSEKVSERPRRTTPRAPPAPSTEPSPTTAIRTLSTLQKGSPKDPAEPLRELPHHPPQRPHRPPTRSLSTLRKGSSKTPRDHFASSATTLHGALTDHLDTLRHHLPRGPQTTSTRSLITLRNRVSERPRRTTPRAPPPPSPEVSQIPSTRSATTLTEPSQTTSARSLSTPKRGLRKTPRDHSAPSATTLRRGLTGDLSTLRHHPPRGPAETPLPAPALPLARGLEDPSTPPPPHDSEAPQTASTPFATTLLRGPTDHPNTLHHQPPERPTKTLRPAPARPLAPASKTPRQPPPPPSQEAPDILGGAARRALAPPCRKSQRPFDQPRHDVSAGPSKTPATSSATPSAEVSEAPRPTLDRGLNRPSTSSATTPQRGLAGVGDAPPAHPAIAPRRHPRWPLGGT